MNCKYIDCEEMNYRHHFVFIFLNLFVLLECPVMPMTFIRVIKF